MDCCCGTQCEKTPSEILSRILSATYVLLVKTQNIHWNVKGSMFGYVHSLTEKHYGELFEAVDEIAERIRQLGERAPGTMSEFLSMSCVMEKLEATSDRDMILELKRDHESLCALLKKAINKISQTDDFVTADILTSRLSYHEKVVWMLESNLG